jgi:hypothetical protein
MLGALFTSLALASAAPPPPPAVFALVVANNVSYDGSRQPLHYADDDGARYAEMFGIAAVDVRLLSVLDADTQRIYPQLVPNAVPPRRAAIRAALAEMFARMETERAAGRKVIFYFVFSGHGDVDERGEGYVHLLDAPFYRSELFSDVIEASPASVNHVVIDACHAYFLVAGRGGPQAVPAGDFGDLVRSLVARERLDAHPNTGVVLSTASVAEVHEWGRIEAGIFSHELRSALTGAGDGDGDGAVDYGEVSAFLAAANGALPDPKVRINAYARPPAQDVREPLMRLPATASRVRLPGDWLGRFWLEDDRGVRYVDFNKAPRHVLTLSLVPRPRYWLRHDGGEYAIEAPVGLLEAADLVERPMALASRGATNDLFDRYLFGIPFSPEFVAGWAQAARDLPDPMRVDVSLEPLVPWRYGAAALAGGLGAGAVVFEVLARGNAAEYRHVAGDAAEVEAVRARAESQHFTAEVMGGLALTSAAIAVGIYVYERLSE